MLRCQGEDGYGRLERGYGRLLPMLCDREPPFRVLSQYAGDDALKRQVRVLFRAIEV